MCVCSSGYQSARVVKTPRFLGIVEGFYGRSWSWETRGAYAGFMASQGMNSYVYAPKGDARLRRAWREPWTQAELAALQACAANYREQGIRFAVGLSPLGLADADGAGLDADSRADLLQKLQQIASIDNRLLCVLFDDVASGGETMAGRQLAVCEAICATGLFDELIVCPSYYSTDPILEKLFGERPRDYWVELGQGLPAQVGLFWTGSQVCSKTYQPADLDYISEQFQRAPVLWDNYPVNDGERSSQFLHLAAFGHDQRLARHVAGHFANPMNQAWLSQIPLRSLARNYRSPAAADEADDFEAVCGVELGRQLREDQPLFERVGLAAMTATQKQTLREHYRQFDHPVAHEVLDWLNDGYAFDPACLTG